MKLFALFLIVFLLLQVFAEALPTSDDQDSSELMDDAGIEASLRKGYHLHKKITMHVQEDAENRRGRMCVIEHAKLVVPDATASLLALMATKVSVPAMPSSRLIVTSPSALSYLITVPCFS
ncbi:hypothetical protein AG4045_002086 [Apium graveolens]|uniref:BURP domain-containing protein n=1 Tax=Apium graveolens TaxID=4045 RepID=A0A6L5B9Q6_APIGR|nr:hypothetical protein AG4045_002086 [Apium graveolens]